MMKSMEDSWGPGISFDEIILDYFFCPAGYVDMRWSKNFFAATLPFLVEKNVLAKGGEHFF